MKLFLLLLFPIAVNAFDTCGKYQAIGEVRCEIERCIFVTAPTTLSEKISSISNMNPKEFVGVSFYLAANVDVKEILNYKQSVIEIKDFQILDDELYQKSFGAPKRILEEKCM